MTAWPSSLPQYLERAGLSVQHRPNAIRWQPDDGVPQARRRGTAGGEDVSGRVTLSQAQIATFRTFYKTTMSEGADVFTWTHPLDGSAATFMFSGEPVYTPVGAGFWHVDLSLIVLP